MGFRYCFVYVDFICIGLMVGDDYGYWSECFEMIGIGFCIIDVGIEYLIEK